MNNTYQSRNSSSLHPKRQFACVWKRKSSLYEELSCIWHGSLCTEDETVATLKTWFPSLYHVIGQKIHGLQLEQRHYICSKLENNRCKLQLAKKPFRTVALVNVARQSHYWQNVRVKLYPTLNQSCICIEV